jgi:lipopolysaccharide exporter
MTESAAESSHQGEARLSDRVAQFARHPFLRDVGTLASGVLAGRLIRILSIPLIARLFDPQHFGQAAFLIALATTLSTAGTLRYAEAILLPSSRHEADQLSRLAVVIGTGFVLLVAVGAAVWPSSMLPSWLAELELWWLLLAVMVALLVAQAVVHAWALRNKGYRWLAAGDVVEGVVSASGRIGWGAAFGSSILGMLFPYMVALTMRLLAYYRGARQPGLGESRAAVETGAAEDAEKQGPPPGLGAIARRYSSFPTYGVPSALMRSLAERMPLLMLGALFTPTIVGLYAVAERLVKVPIEGVSQSIRKVFAQRAAIRRRRGQSLLPILSAAVGALAGVAALPFGLLMVYADPLFTVVLGERWAGAGDYVEAIALWGYSLFLVGPANATLMVLEQQRVQLSVNAARAALFAAIAALTVVFDWSALRAVQCLAVAGVASNAWLLLMAFLIARRPLPAVTETNT